MQAILLILDNGKKAEDLPSLSAATVPKKSATGTAPAPSSTLHDSFAADAARLLAPKRKYAPSLLMHKTREMPELCKKCHALSLLRHSLGYDRKSVHGVPRVDLYHNSDCETNLHF